MAWKTVSIEKPANLRLKNNQLVIKQEDKEVLLPIEDIDSLILDGHISVTKELLSFLADKGVNVVFCNEKHLPNATLINYFGASRASKISKAQLEMSEPFKKQLWRKIIVQKITNQASVLKKYNLEYEDLIKLSKLVRSGDAGNNESIAARLYFNRLLDGSTRRQPMFVNSALNYGYAIVRSKIAQCIASRGLITSLGINHHSELNSYNLVDDLIEPFRPFVDDFVMEKILPKYIGEEDKIRLDQDDRHVLLAILNKNGIIIDKSFELKTLIYRTIESFASAILESDTEVLLLPKIIN